jgi:hypothetical protein
MQTDYDLCVPLGEVDCRGTFDHKGTKRPKSHRIVWLDKDNIKHLPMGRTMIGTTNRDYPFDFLDKDHINLPFRDGAHASWDNERLGGLPMFFKTPSVIFELLPEPKEQKASVNAS